MKILDKLLYNSKSAKRRRELLEDYNSGAILQVGKNIDNKENIRKRRNKNGNT
jgi:hypothetical protein